MKNLLRICAIAAVAVWCAAALLLLLGESDTMGLGTLLAVKIAAFAATIGGFALLERLTAAYKWRKGLEEGL